MKQFKVIAGKHHGNAPVDGTKARKVYRVGDIVESKHDLVSLFPNKFERVHTDADEDSDEDSYADWTKAALVEELQERELSTSGKKDALIARLEADDEAGEDEDDA